MKSSVEIAQNRFLGGISASSIRNLLPRSVSTKRKTNSIRSKPKADRENTPPIDPNIQIENGPTSPSIPKKTVRNVVNLQNEPTQSIGEVDASVPPDPSVQVVVRMRPVNGCERKEDRLVQKVSPNSLSVGNRTFSFDSVVDWNSSQEDIFQLVGVPLVKNSLAGFNTSILSYGQSGSGKTYTMWGPPSAMLEGHSCSSHQGLVPRIFQMLFSEIQKVQQNSEEKQINFQCRCSFLEIYNEHIGDLLDPTQRNLEIKDEAKNGFYLENLTEEYVSSYEDVTQILVKGLSSRKVGATSINSKSSRSHIVFTCIIESWSKGLSSKCFSSSKTSRISLVDLAGLETNKPDAGRQCAKESKNVKKSLSQLGHLVKILSDGAYSGKSQNVAFRRSCLTHLLQESLGGNAKLTVICSISPDDKCRNETLSTLRFGQRANSIKNEPVINEITEDDVNDLSDQIRQLKEELIRAKSNVHNPVVSDSSYFKGRNARESLNQLRLSLNRSLILPRIDNDCEKEINVDEEDVRELCVQLENIHVPCEEDSREPNKEDSVYFTSIEESFEMDVVSEDDTISQEENNTTERNLGKSEKELPCKENVATVQDLPASTDTSSPTDPASRNRLSIRPCLQSAFLEEPTLSESPKIESTQRKSIAASSNHVSDSSKLNPDVLRQSLRRSAHIRSSQSSNIYSSPTESLAASLHRGLQIIDNHQRNSVSNRSSVAFSFEHLTLKPCEAVNKADAGVQTPSEERPLVCPSCRQTEVKYVDCNEVQDSLNMWIAPVDEARVSMKLTDQVHKHAEKALAEATRREKELENVCAEQAAKIEQLNNLIEKYNSERGCSCLIEQSNALTGVVTAAIPIKQHKNEEHWSSEDESTLLRDHGENHPVGLGENNKFKEHDRESDAEHGSTSFDISEREALVKEIQSLRNRLQSYMNASPDNSTDKQISSSILSESAELKRIDANNEDKNEEELEKERQRWTKMESEWISLTDELRIDLESNRRQAEKMESELRSEKKCTEELDDALHRAVLGHGRIIEHYAELQEKYNELLERHRKIMEGIAEVKRAAAKAGAKGTGSRFFKSLAAELSALRVQREKEREYLKKENKSLKIQLRDTAEAVHAAGELLVRLREAEEAASVSEENFTKSQQEIDTLKKQMEKLKRKHKMEMITMKQYLAESRLPESALHPLYSEESDISDSMKAPLPHDDQAWRAEFRPIYQQHY